MIKIAHVKVDNSTSKSGYVTIAMRCPGKDSGSNVYTAEFSFCSPKEKSFMKKKGSKVAVGRLTGRSNPLTFSFNGNPKDAFLYALSLTISNGMAPRWLIASAMRGNHFTLGLSQKKIKPVMSFVKNSFVPLWKVTEATSNNIITLSASELKKIVG